MNDMKTKGITTAKGFGRYARCLGLLLFVLMIFSGSVRAQTVIASAVDSLSGDTSKLTSTEQLYGQPGVEGSGGKQLFFNILRLNGHYLLTLVLQTQLTESFTVSADSTTYINFADTTAVEVHPDLSVTSGLSAVGSGNTVVIYYSLSDQLFNALLNDTLSKIEIPYSAGIFEFEIANDDALKLKGTASLLKSP